LTPELVEKVAVLENAVLGKEVVDVKVPVEPSKNMDEQMFGPTETSTDVMPPQNPTLPTTDKGPVNLKNKLNPGQPGNDKGNLDGLGFEEVSCDV
jgi:hypothetical protein